MKRRTALLAVVMAMIGVAMLAGGSDDDDKAGDFDSRLRAGAPCSELFAIRNELDEILRSGLPYERAAARGRLSRHQIGTHRLKGDSLGGRQSGGAAHSFARFPRGRNDCGRQPLSQREMRRKAAVWP